MKRFVPIKAVVPGFMLCIGAAVSLALGQPTTQPVDITTPTAAFIDLQMTDAPPAQALKHFEDALDAKIEPVPDTIWSAPGPQPTRISLDFKSVPFWTALEKFCSAAHVKPAKVDGRAAMTLVPDQSNSPLGGPMDDRGLFAVVAIGARHDRSVSIADGTTSRNDQIELRVLVDPRVKLAGFSGSAYVDRADDENGLSLLAPNDSANKPDGTFWDDCTWTFTCGAPLMYQPSRGKKLVRFKGSIRVRVATKMTDLVIDDLSKAIGQQFSDGKRTLLIKDFKIENDHAAKLSYVISKPPGAPTFYVALLNENRFIHVIDGEGHRQVPGGGGSGNDERFELSATIQNRDMHFASGKPVKLEWKLITEAREMDIPFDFHDLPLPQE